MYCIVIYSYKYIVYLYIAVQISYYILFNVIYICICLCINNIFWRHFANILHGILANHSICSIHLDTLDFTNLYAINSSNSYSLTFAHHYLLSLKQYTTFENKTLFQWLLLLITKVFLLMPIQSYSGKFSV